MDSLLFGDTYFLRLNGNTCTWKLNVQCSKWISNVCLQTFAKPWDQISMKIIFLLNNINWYQHIKEWKIKVLFIKYISGNDSKKLYSMRGIMIRKNIALLLRGNNSALLCWFVASIAS